MNPLDLTGPEFLPLYLILAGMALVCGIGLRLLASMPWSPLTSFSSLARRAKVSEGLQLDPYEVAYLAGGETLAVHAAIAVLVHTSYLSVDTTTRRLHRTKEPEADRHPLEEAVFTFVGPDQGSTVKEIEGNVRRIVSQSSARPRALGLILSEDQAMLARLLTTAPLVLVLLLGVAKVFVGISRGKSTEFLVFLCIGTAILAFLIFKWKPLRTVRGTFALSKLKEKNTALSYTSRREPGRLAHDDLVLALGLFGMAVLASGPLQDLQRVIHPPPSAGSSWTSCGSSCGSSCGGGCGGGGCGGCGG
jgi:uncharacterized protein (TIGR04222 family)